MQVFVFPLARVSLVFVLGIAIGHLTKPPVLWLCFVLGVLFFGAGISYFLLKKAAATALIICSFLVLGALGFCWGDERRNPFHYTPLLTTQHQNFTLEITEKLRGNAKFERYVARVRQIDGKMATGSLLLQVPRDSTRADLGGGQMVLAFARADDVRPPLNPEQFDYAAYLKLKNIHSQMFLSPGHFKILGHFNKGTDYYTDYIRRGMIQRLTQDGFNPRELAVLNALILGQQQDISKDIMQDYQYAGAVHILSVSGLHVGILLLLLNHLLEKGLKLPARSPLKLGLLLVSLWGFALLAGGAPSIIRAVAMFSFVALGLHLRRPSCIFHTLLTSILVILVFKPAFLFDIGFQLSYLALFFIVWLQPQLSKCYTPRYSVGRYFWDILTVSTAAQLGTLPLSLYYFHQFPGLFFVTNLVILPCLGVMMAAGILAVLWTIAGSVPAWLIWVNETGIRLLNEFIASVASVENFVWHNIPFDKTGVWLIYVALVFFGIWTRHLRFKMLFVALLALLVFQGYGFAKAMSLDRGREFLVLHQYKHSAILIREGRDCTLFIDTLDASARKYLVAPYETARRLKSVRQETPRNLYVFNRKRVLVIDSDFLLPQVKADVVILSKGTKVNLERLISHYRPEMIVADGSNYRYQTAIWEATCLKQKIPFHATAEKGFFSLSKSD